MICKEYPEMPEIAREYGTWRKGQPQISEGVEDCTLDFALFAINIRTTTQLVKNVYTHAWKRFFDRKTVSTIIANKTALEEVAKWKNSEQYVSKMLGTKARPQVSYLNGKEVPYGTKGSVRPDFVIGNKAAFEVKNYDIAKNSDGLIRTVVRQVKERAIHLPKGMKQNIMIDVRGQNVSDMMKKSLGQKIVQKCDGIVSMNDVKFL